MSDPSLHTKFLTSPGSLGRMIRDHDWGATPLGPIEAWPQSLKTTISLMLSSRQPMWIGWGPHATFLYNDAYISVLGQAKHPWALGRPAAEVWSEIWDICGPLAAVVFEQGDATLTDDVRLFMNRGDFLEETFFSFSYSPIRDESDNVAGLFCPNLDVTSKHLNARRLRTLSDLATRSLAAKTIEAACVSAVDILRDNPDDVPFALLYLGADDGARLVKSANLAAAGADAEGLFEVAEVLRSGQPRRITLHGQSWLPAGLAGQRVTQALVLPLHGAGQQTIGALVAAVSPARKLDDDYRSFFELLATQVGNAIQTARAAEDERMRIDMLAEVDRAKTQFFSNVSHEFRTPLTLMLGPMEEALTDEQAPLPAAQRERLQLMRRNAMRLQKLVNTLLEFSRVQAGRAEPVFAPTDLAALTLDLASSFRSMIENACMRLLVEAEPLAGAVYLDQSMWETIFLNLMSNAFKFTLSGEIRVTLTGGAGQALLTVADTGAGIPADHLPRLFERFHRIAGTSSRTHEGSGIGLALVHDLVALHGGSITVDSELGRGTTFRIALPLGRAHLRAEQVREAPSAPAPHSAVNAYLAEAGGWIAEPAAEALAPVAGALSDMRERILVADDNADMRDYVSRLLQGRWRVEAVNDGLAALAAVRRHPPDLVVSDVMMPHLDGFGLLAALRAGDATRQLPLVLLSARAGEEARVEGLQAGADDYLVKPFSGRELVARIESLLLRSRVRRIEAAAARRLQMIFGQAPVAIAILRGAEHLFEQSNALFQELTGNRALIGLPIRSAMPELAGQQIFQLLDNVYRSGVPYIGRSVRVDIMRGAPAQLTECYFDFVYQPLKDDAGHTEGVAVVVFEVTQLANAKRAAESANRAKDDFLAMLGHELRNPLAPIVTAVQLMRVRGVPGAEKERAIIERQAKHLVTLVDDLLDVARVAQGKVQLHRQRVEMAEVIARAIETASPLIEQKNHHLTLDVAPDGLAVHADPARLAQVLANLITNAAKYTAAGGEIGIACRRAGADVVLEVTDNGIGIDRAILPSIFDMFVQERQALSRAQGGLGLGLAIARSMMLAHEGSVTAHSEGLGHGSTFTLRLPASEAVQGQLPTHAEPHGDPLGGLSILIVDDNEDSARMLGEILALKGHRITLAFDALSALEQANRDMPEVALLDIGLPGMDGYELAGLLRQLAGDLALKMVAVTGYGQESDRMRAIASGFDQHLSKPVDLSKLDQFLANVA